MVGVAPQALVMPLRVLDDNGGGNSADVAAAFAYAGERGVRVVNASLGSPYPSQAERRAIREHPSTLFVVAAGNGGPDGIGDDNDDDTREYPCAHEEPNLICVGATDANDARAAFSNYGTTSVDLLAPGQDIVSDWVGGHQTVLDQYFGVGAGFEIMQGTSMASPHVAGAAALAAALPARMERDADQGARCWTAPTGSPGSPARRSPAAASTPPATVRIAAGQTGAPDAAGAGRARPGDPGARRGAARRASPPRPRLRRPSSAGSASAAGRRCAGAAAARRAPRRSRSRSPPTRT